MKVISAIQDQMSIQKYLKSVGICHFAPKTAPPKYNWPDLSFE